MPGSKESIMSSLLIKSKYGVGLVYDKSFVFYRHLHEVQNDTIRPITSSKFDKQTLSNYNHCYSSLLTVDELREMNR